MQIDEVYLGDCCALIKQIKPASIDVCITDLPYGIDYQSARRINKNSRFDKIANDKQPFVDFIKHLPRVMKNTGAIYLFTRWDKQQAVIDELVKYDMPPKNVLIWDKGNHSMGDLKRAYASRYESIVFCPMPNFQFQNGRPDDIVFCNKVPPEQLVHPNEKPIKLLQKLILDSTRIGDVVLDCTCGSGTTLLAAIKEKRRFIGFELDKRYYDIAHKRIAQEKQQLTINFDI